MNQPPRLRLPSAHPGIAYQHDVALRGYLLQPLALVRLCYGPGGRLVGLQPTVRVLNNTSNLTYWTARISLSADIVDTQGGYWLELFVNGELHSGGPFTVTYQT